MSNDTPTRSPFELAYRLFMERGGFDQPAVTERVEREYRELERHRAKICPHGKSKLRCTECYFSDGWGKS